MRSPLLLASLLLPLLLHGSATWALEMRIGIVQGVESMAWHNARHAVDEWNNANAVNTGISLSLVAVVDGFSTADDRMCDVLQRKVVAILVGEDGTASPEDLKLTYSMCNRFQVPCMSIGSSSTLGNTRFVTSVGPPPGLLGRAAAELIRSLAWNSFLLVYQDVEDLVEISDLLSVWHNERGTRTLLKVLQLPRNHSLHEIFFKHVRERLKQKNLIVHTKDVGSIHAVLSAATFLGMTESRYSFMFTNPDLSLLDDFFQSLRMEYQCNITGFQLVQHDPMMKAALALTMDAVQVVGTALSSLHAHGNLPVPEALLCESDDTWTDGTLINEAIRQVRLDRSMSGRVMFDERGRRLNATLTGITRTAGRFQKLGTFDSGSDTWQFEHAYNHKWRFAVNGSIVDLAGQRLKVVVYLEEPFVIKVADGIGYDGFCIDLLIEMSKILNFTFEIIEVEDGAYGVEDESGQWNGIIGVLQRHEADLSVSAVTITYSRVSVIDFTLPFMHLGIAILMGKNIEDPNAPKSNSLFTFLEPLSFSVWLALAFSYLAVGTTMWLLARFSPYEWFEANERDSTMDNHKNQFSLLNSLWFAVGSLMQQGSDVIPRAGATRMVAVAWWWFTLLMIASYTAQLAAFLTVERMNTPIESAADLANQQRIKFGALKNGSTMDFFRESKIPIYERMWSQMQGQSPTVFVNSSKEAIARVKAGNYAYMMESSMLEYYMKTDCQLQTIGGLLDSKGYGVAVPKGSPLRDVLSKTVLQLQERTILEALKNKWWQRAKMLECPEDEGTQRFDQVFGIFYVLLTGLVVACLIAVGEYCIESKQQSVRLDLTLLGQLFNWWHRRRHEGDRKLLTRRSPLTVTNLDSLASGSPPACLTNNNNHDNEPWSICPAMSRPPTDGHRYLMDEPLQSPIMASLERRQTRADYRKISRLIPPGDEALISRRISTISR